MGRKSMAEARRAEILAAFERCIARDGLDVPLERIADEAGVQRSLIRHYLGNRDELVAQLIAQLAEDYPRRIGELLAPRLGQGPQCVLDFFFGDELDGSDWDNLLLNVVHTGQGQYPQAKQMVARMVEAITEQLAGLLAELYPGSSHGARYEAAYGIICLFQTNEDLRCLGIDARHMGLARASGARLLAALGEPTTPEWGGPSAD